MFLWVIYGIIRKDPVIIGTNAAGFILNIILMTLKLKYNKARSIKGHKYQFDPIQMTELSFEEYSEFFLLLI